MLGGGRKENNKKSMGAVTAPAGCVTKGTGSCGVILGKRVVLVARNAPAWRVIGGHCPIVFPGGWGGQ